MTMPMMLRPGAESTAALLVSLQKGSYLAGKDLDRIFKWPCPSSVLQKP